MNDVSTWFAISAEWQLGIVILLSFLISRWSGRSIGKLSAICAPRGILVRSGDFRPSFFLEAFPLVGSVVMAFRRRDTTSAPYLWSIASAEIFLSLTIPLLYWWEVLNLGLGAPESGVLLARFVSHVILVVLLVAAFTTDFLHQVIPDEVTVVGTILAIFIATATPEAFLPVYPVDELRQSVGASPPTKTWASYSEPWSFNRSFPEKGASGLGLGLGAYLLWLVAVFTPEAPRRGSLIVRAHLLVRRLIKNLGEWGALTLCLVGPVIIFLTWLGKGAGWSGMLTALVGNFGGILIGWSVRATAYLLLRKEALGFGDVLFLGTIGGFLGWQGALLTFMAAPFVALPILFIIGLKRSQPAAFGPFLSVASILVLINWRVSWQILEAIILNFTGLFMILFKIRP